jgi:L-ascorbate metabolism protein UlaG (beta-lactamase superfamily)
MYLLDDGEASCLFVGDSGPGGEAERVVRDGLGGRRLDLALLPINYAPWWEPGFRSGHLTAADALSLSRRLYARHLVPHHWGTFNFLNSGAFDAVERLRDCMANERRTATDAVVHLLQPGERFQLARGPREELVGVGDSGRWGARKRAGSA